MPLTYFVKRVAPVVTLYLLCIFNFQTANAQKGMPPQDQVLVDSLRIELATTFDAESRGEILLEMSRAYELGYADSIAFYAELARKIALRINDGRLEALAQVQQGVAIYKKRDIPGAIAAFQTAVKGLEAAADTTEALRIIFRLAMLQNEVGDTAGSRLQFERGWAYANALTSKRYLVEYWWAKAISHFFENRLAAAKSAFINALEVLYTLPERNQDLALQRREAKILINLGSMYVEAGRYDSAAIVLVAAAEANLRMGDRDGLGLAYANLCATFSHSRDDHKALEYGMLANKIFQEGGRCIQAGKIQLTMALVNKDMENEEQYHQHLLRSVRSFESCGPLTGDAIPTFSELGFFYFDQGEEEKSLICFKKVEQVYREEIRMNIDVQFAVGYGMLSLQRKDLKKTREMLDLIEQNMPDRVSNEVRLQYLQLLTEYHAEKGEFAQGLAASQSMMALRDSLQNAQLLAQVEETQLKYDIARQDQKALEAELATANVTLALDEKSSRLQRWIIGSLLGALVLIILLVALQRSAQAKKRQLERARLQAIAREAVDKQKREAMREKIRLLERQALQAQMNPHFTFNCLAALQRFIQDGNQRKAEHYLDQFSFLVRSILESSRHPSLVLSDVIAHLEAYLNLEKMRLGDRLSFEIHTAPDLETDLIRIPAMMIQPFVENAVLHGIFPKSGPGKITIQLEEAGDDLLVTISDDGVGRAAAAVRKLQTAPAFPSLATKITQERLSLISPDTASARIRYSDLHTSDGQAAGTTVHLSIPIQN